MSSRLPNVPSQGGLFNWELSPISICPGLDIDGLYRVSGNLATIQKLRYKVEHGTVTCGDSGGQWDTPRLEGQGGGWGGDSWRPPPIPGALDTPEMLPHLQTSSWTWMTGAGRTSTLSPGR